MTATELLATLLSAGPPAAQPPAPASPSDALTPLYVLVGTAVVAQLAAGIVGLIKWLGNRTVEREDADKKALQGEIDKLKAAIEKLEGSVDERLEEVDDAVKEMDKSFSTMSHDVHQMRDTFTQLKTSVDAITQSMEGRIDKQGQFYRDEVAKLLAAQEKKLEDMEYRLRADATRAMRDAQTLSRAKSKR